MSLGFKTKTTELIKRLAILWIGVELEDPKPVATADKPQQQFPLHRTEEILAYSKQLWTESIASLKAVHDRSDKVIAGSILVCGWVVSSAKPSCTPYQTACWVFSATALMFGLVTLLLGRWRLTFNVPMSFEKFVSHAWTTSIEGKSAKIEADDPEDAETLKAKWQFRQARQYALATADNQRLVRHAQMRLLTAIVALVVGLFCLAIRGV